MVTNTEAAVLEPRAAWLVRESEALIASAQKIELTDLGSDANATDSLAKIMMLATALEAWASGGRNSGAAQFGLEVALIKAARAYTYLYDEGLAPDLLSPDLQGVVGGEASLPASADEGEATPPSAGATEALGGSDVAPCVSSAAGDPGSPTIPLAADVPEVFGLPVHPAAEIFPMLAGSQLDSLVEDIKRRGVLEPLTVVRESGGWFLLDGRNRRKAAAILGIAVPFVVYTGTAPATFVRSKNLRRRHLRGAQRLAVAKALSAEVKREKENRRIAATGIGPREGGNIATSDSSNGKTRDRLASELGVSSRTAQDLLTVDAKASPELKQAVEEGVSPHVAAQVAGLPADQQRQVVDDARRNAGGSAKGLKRALSKAAKSMKKKRPAAGKPSNKKKASRSTAAPSTAAAFGAVQAGTGAAPGVDIPGAWELMSNMASTESGVWTGEGALGGVHIEFMFEVSAGHLFVRRPHGTLPRTGKK